MADNYHKDNLKELLIKTSIEMISKEGIDALSMRNLALKCGVSRGAPYNYFENKEMMLNEISSYVSDEFSEYLRKSIEGLDRKNSKILNVMGRHI